LSIVMGPLVEEKEEEREQKEGRRGRENTKMNYRDRDYHRLRGKKGKKKKKEGRKMRGKRKGECPAGQEHQMAFFSITLAASGAKEKIEEEKGGPSKKRGPERV